MKTKDNIERIALSAKEIDQNSLRIFNNIRQNLDEYCQTLGIGEKDSLMFLYELAILGLEYIKKDKYRKGLMNFTKIKKQLAKVESIATKLTDCIDILEFEARTILGMSHFLEVGENITMDFHHQWLIETLERIVLLANSSKRGIKHISRLQKEKEEVPKQNNKIHPDPFRDLIEKIVNLVKKYSISFESLTNYKHRETGEAKGTFFDSIKSILFDINPELKRSDSDLVNKINDAILDTRNCSDS